MRLLTLATAWRDPVRVASLSVVLLATASVSPAAEDGPLIQAIKQGDAQAVKALLSRRPDVNVRAADGSTALHWAVHRSDTAIVRQLLGMGADVQAANRFGVKPLSLASVNGNAAIVDLLLNAGADVNSAAAEGETALMTAARSGNVATLKVLLDWGADPNALETWRGQSALMWAAAEGHAAAIPVLVGYGADIAARSKGGVTPLLFAVRGGHIDSSRALLALGADVNAVAKDRMSPLTVAIVNSHYELAALLVEHGADVNVDTPAGFPLHALAWARRPGTPILPPRSQSGSMDSLALAEKLLKSGARTDVRISWEEREQYDSARQPAHMSLGRTYTSYAGATPFYLAAKHADLALMRLLLAHGADPKLKTAESVTPFVAAAGVGFWEGESPGTEAEALEAVKLLLEVGAGNVNEITRDGDTALHGAAVRGANSIVMLLVTRGAKLDAMNKEGWTPLTIADGVFIARTYKRQPATAQLLRELAEKGGVVRQEVR
jgi:ankyrin repeat protein